MRHPLAGADLPTLWAALRQGGAPDRLTRALPVLAAAAARTPASLLERALVEPRLPALSTLPPPVFIVGHWRSGTTHLYNAMALGGFGAPDPIDVGLPWDMFGLAALMRPLLERMVPSSRWIDSVPVTPSSPQEDEIALASMTACSFLHAIYFPRRFDALLDRGLFLDGVPPAEVALRERRIVLFVRKLAQRTGRRVLVKNPAHTAHVPMLRRLFPGARFIHIHRDPLDVFVSMRRFYARMLDALALQRAAPPDIDGAILRVYERMMTAWLDAARDAPPNEIVELPYAALAADPLGALERIDAALGIQPGAAERAARERYLAASAGYRSETAPPDRAGLDRAREALTPWIERWGAPAPAGAA